MNTAKMLFSVGDFKKIYDPGEEPVGVTWHINDHCFFQGQDGLWHMIGIAYPDPEYPPLPLGILAHATAHQLTQFPWQKQLPALTLAPNLGETVLWAPHIVEHAGTYYMFYCSGSKDPVAFGMSLATSTDLWQWTRHPDVLFRDGFQGRDPMVLWLPDEQQWVMYYCATDEPTGGYHAVAYRTSTDLIHWSTREIAFRDNHSGTDYGPTESPFVVRRGKFYYLFIGPRPYDPPTSSLPNWEHPGYDGTDVYRSLSWKHWEQADYIGHINAHAAEVVRDTNGDWYVSHAGIKRGGLYIAPLHWFDNEDEQNTSL